MIARRGGEPPRASDDEEGSGAGRLPGIRGWLHRLSTRLYGPVPSARGFHWIGDERIAIGGVPTGPALLAILEQGVTHVVNVRATLQTRLSLDLWAERALLGRDRVAHAPMWDSGRPQPSVLWAPAVEFAVAALDADAGNRVLIHCQQGRRRSVLVAYAVLRSRGHGPEDAARLIAEGREVARLIPSYRDSVERWLAGRPHGDAVR